MYQQILSQNGFSMDRLASFCDVADAGSIAAIAKGDPSRQALVSRQIRELETFFGTDLIRRKGRGLELTEAGLELATIGRHQFKGLEDYICRSRKSDWVVKIVTSNSIAQWLLLPRLEQVMKLAPGVRFEIHHEQTRDMITGVREGIYDVAFVRKDALIPGLKKSILGTITHSLYIPKQLSKTAPTSLVESLTNLPLALPIGGRMRENLDRLAAKQGQPLNIAVACTSNMQAAQLVAAGTCAAALPDIATTHQLQRLSSRSDLKSAPPLMQPKRIRVDFQRFSISEFQHFPHRLPIPDQYPLCLTWTARNTETRPALSRLIEVLSDTMSL